MNGFSEIEDTTFVPMLGRIYASKNFPKILNDQKALELEEKLPKNIKGKETQTQYTLLAGAIRSANMDRYIQDFLKRKENGVIVELGCGLETTFYRNNNNKTKWYEVDLENVIKLRKNLLGENKLYELISSSAFSEEWIKKVRSKYPNEPILVTISGLLFYFEKEEVYNLIRFLKKYGDIEIVFDIFNSMAMKNVHRYMKQVGHEEVKMYFYLDEVETIKKDLELKYIIEEPYYKNINKKGMGFKTKMTMKISDLFRMVKMIHIKLK